MRWRNWWVDGLLHVVFVRSTMAHAELLSVDVDEAMLEEALREERLPLHPVAALNALTRALFA